MNRMNTAGRLLALIMTVLLVLIMAACGEKDGNKTDNMNNKDNMGSMDNMGGDDSSMDNEPKNEDEATAMHKDLMAQKTPYCQQIQSFGKRYSWRPIRA